MHSKYTVWPFPKKCLILACLFRKKVKLLWSLDNPHHFQCRAKTQWGEGHLELSLSVCLREFCLSHSSEKIVLVSILFYLFYYDSTLGEGAFRFRFAFVHPSVHLKILRQKWKSGDIHVLWTHF